MKRFLEAILENLLPSYFFFEFSTFLFFLLIRVVWFLPPLSHIDSVYERYIYFPWRWGALSSVVALRGDWHVWDCLAEEKDDVDVIRLCACSGYKRVRVIFDIILYFILCSLLEILWLAWWSTFIGNRKDLLRYANNDIMILCI